MVHGLCSWIGARPNSGEQLKEPEAHSVFARIRARHEESEKCAITNSYFQFLMKILVTGSAGFIGANLVLILAIFQTPLILNVSSR